MVKNLFVLLFAVSLFLHIGFLCLIEPVLGPIKSETVFYSWGQFNDTGILQFNRISSPPDNLLNSYDDFLLPLEKHIHTNPEKVKCRFSLFKSSEAYDVSESYAKKTLPYLFSYHRPYPQQNIELSTFINNAIFFNKPLNEHKIILNLLISPSGRVIYIKKPSFYCTIPVRFDLEDWARNLVFAPQHSYYWKNMEIVLK